MRLSHRFALNVFLKRSVRLQKPWMTVYDVIANFLVVHGLNKKPQTCFAMPPVFHGLNKYHIYYFHLLLLPIYWSFQFEQILCFFLQNGWTIFRRRICD